MACGGGTLEDIEDDDEDENGEDEEDEADEAEENHENDSNNLEKQISAAVDDKSTKLQAINNKNIEIDESLFTLEDLSNIQDELENLDI